LGNLVSPLDGRNRYNKCLRGGSWLPTEADDAIKEINMGERGSKKDKEKANKQKKEQIEKKKEIQKSKMPVKKTA